MKFDTKKILITLLILAIIGLGIWLILKKPNEKKEDGITPVIKFPLKFGSSGYGVEQVQKYLNQKYNAGLKVDGEWGPVTDSAVQKHLMRDNISKSVFNKWELSKI